MRLVWRLWLIVMLALSGWAVLPRATEAVRIFVLKDDPVARAEHQLSRLNPEHYETAITEAIADDDGDLAASLLALADERGITITPETRQAVTRASATDTARMAGNIVRGAVTGEADSPEGFYAALAADFTTIGDIRDLTREAVAYPDHDPIIVALAGTGLALTAVTIGSGGAALPARAGVAVFKAARRTGRLSARLTRELGTMSRRLIDPDALQSVAATARAGDGAAARRAAKGLIRSDEAKALGSVAARFGRIWKRQGFRGTAATLRVADSTDDIARLGRLSTRYGPGYRGVLQLLPHAGKALMRLGRLVAELLGWIGAALLWTLVTMRYAARVSFRGLALASRPFRARAASADRPAD